MSFGERKIMAKKDNNIGNDEVHFIIDGEQDATQQQQTENRDEGREKHLKDALKQMRNRTSESDEAPSASLRLRDVLGGDFLWTLVRRQIWLIILIVVVVTAYVAVRYQCQQDAIDIAQLEKDLEGAKFESLSSSSNLTRMSRQSNIIKLLQENDSTSTLHHAEQPPYIINVPEEK